VEHLTFDEENRLCVTLPKSKTNQHGELEQVWILPARCFTCLRVTASGHASRAINLIKYHMLSWGE